MFHLKLDRVSHVKVFRGIHISSFLAFVLLFSFSCDLLQKKNEDMHPVLLPLLGSSSSDLRIFVTAKDFRGDMGGIEGAHALCNTDENTPPTGEYRAMLFGATLFFPEQKYVRSTDSAVIGKTDDAGNFSDPLDTAILGSSAYGGLSELVWTGNIDEHCNGYTSSSSSDSGFYGNAIKNTVEWSGVAATTCNNYRRLYCVEVPEGYGTGRNGELVTIQDYARTQSTGTFSNISGTKILSENDDSIENVPLAFAFHYLGREFNSINIATNGYANLDTGISTADNVSLFNSTGPAMILAPWFDDLLNTEDSSISYTTLGSAPDRIFVAQWKDIHRKGTSNKYDFQLRLYETSNIVEFIYGSSSGADSVNASIGLKDKNGGENHFIDGTTGSTSTGNPYLNHSDFPVEGTIYRFEPDVIIDMALESNLTAFLTKTSENRILLLLIFTVAVFGIIGIHFCRKCHRSKST